MKRGRLISTGRGRLVPCTDHAQQENLSVHPKLAKVPKYNSSSHKCRCRSDPGRKPNLTRQVDSSPSGRRSSTRGGRSSKRSSTTLSHCHHSSPARTFLISRSRRRDGTRGSPGRGRWETPRGLSWCSKHMLIFSADTFSTAVRVKSIVLRVSHSSTVGSTAAAARTWLVWAAMAMRAVVTVPQWV